MPRKLISAQAPFTMLVANIKGASDPSKGTSGNPVKLRSTFTVQNFPEIPGRGPETITTNPKTPGVGTRLGLVHYTTPPVPVRATGTITVASNTFTGPTTLQLGAFLITSGQEFAIGGGVNATATNLAAAISNLPGYAASPLGAVVTVTGLVGPIGNVAAFWAGGSNPQNFTFSPTNGAMSGAEPSIGAPEIT